MVVVDDLHWADAASVDLLCEVVDQLADRPLMLLVLQRPDGRAVRTLRAEHALVELGPLGDEEARSLVGHLLGTPAADDGLAPLRDFVAARAGGNPLFVEEIVRSLAGSGLLVRKDGRWVCEAGCDAPDVPSTLYGLLLSRIDRLAAEDRRALQEAAVLGAEFDRTLLQRIASAPRSTEAALHRLAAADLIHADASGGQHWRFTHALLHEVAYQNLLLARRTELHQRAGRALEAELGADAQALVDGEARSPRRLAELEALGHHWSLSPDKARGAHYLLAAGDWARSVYANDDAIRHYERALRTLAEAARGHRRRSGRGRGRGARRARAARRPARPDGAAHRGAGALRARQAGGGRAARSGASRAPAAQDRRPALGGRRARARGRLLRRRPGVPGR